MNPGSPGATSTSTRMTRPSSATSVADSSVASTPPPYRTGAYLPAHQQPRASSAYARPERLPHAAPAAPADGRDLRREDASIAWASSTISLLSGESGFE